MSLPSPSVARPPERLSAAEGFAGVLVGAAASDGHISHQEALEVASALGHQALFKGLGDRQVHAMFTRLAQLARAKGPEGLLDAAAPSVPADLRESAYANAVDLVMGGGEVAEQELSYLRRAQAALGVSEDLARRIHDVMQIKYRG